MAKTPLILGMLLFLITTLSYSATITKIVDHGPDANRVVFVIVAEGYTSAEQDSFNTHSQRIISVFFDQEPWKSYKDFINIYQLNVVSQQSGCDMGSTNVNTAFDAFLIDNAPNYNGNKLTDSLNTYLSKVDCSILLVNIGQDFGNGPPNVAVVTRSTEMVNTVWHELGHSFGKLTDEYVSAGNTAPVSPGPEPNYAVPPDTTPETVKWAAWVTPDSLWPNDTLVWPTPKDFKYVKIVGLVKGAKYTIAAYRPEVFCMMGQGAGQYCRVCTEAIVWQIKLLVKEIDAPTYPRNASVGYTNTPVEFNLGLLGIQDLKYDITWYIDGAPLPERSEIYSLDPVTLNLGTSTHSFKAIVKDTSNYFHENPWDTVPFVKYDPRHLMNDTIQWTLEYGIGIEQRMLAQIIPTLSVRREASGVRITTNPQGEYTLGVYNIHGQRVAELGQGFSRVTRDFTYAPRSAGVYFVRLIANKKQYMNKVVFFR